jgi:hypothetical protein
VLINLLSIVYCLLQTLFVPVVIVPDLPVDFYLPWKIHHQYTLIFRQRKIKSLGCFGFGQYLLWDSLQPQRMFMLERNHCTHKSRWGVAWFDLSAISSFQYKKQHREKARSLVGGWMMCLWFLCHRRLWHGIPPPPPPQFIV